MQKLERWREEASERMRFKSMRWDERLFLAGFAIWMAFEILGWATFFASYVPSVLAPVVRYSFVAVMVASEVAQVARGLRWSWKSWLGCALVLAVAACCFAIGNERVCVGALCVFFARNKDLGAMLAVSIAVMCAMLVVTVIAMAVGFLPNYGWFGDGEGIRTRFFIGFLYPLYPAMLVFSSTLASLYLLGAKIGVRVALVLVAINVLFYLVTGSRLSFGLALLAILLTYFVAAKREGGVVSPRASAALASLCIVAVVGSIGITLMYDPSVPWLEKLNAALVDRLQLGKDGLATFGITLFGQKIQMVGHGLLPNGEHSTGTYNWVDNVYIHLLVRYGLLAFVAYVAGMVASCYQAFRRGSCVLGVLIIIVSLHGTIDNMCIFLWMNAMLLAWGLPISENGKAGSRVLDSLRGR